MVFREIDRVKVKGKDEAITTYEPLEPETGDAELREWQAVLHAYRARDWEAADMSLEKRCNPPPSDWDGVTVFDEN